MSTDKELLDFLQELNDRSEYTKCCILRMSGTGRGWRLHETSEAEAVSSVREAIEKFKAFVKDAEINAVTSAESRGDFEQRNEG